MVDTFYVVADNTGHLAMVRDVRHPPVGELGEVDDK